MWLLIISLGKIDSPLSLDLTIEMKNLTYSFYIIEYFN